MEINYKPTTQASIDGKPTIVTLSDADFMMSEALKELTEAIRNLAVRLGR